MSRNNYNGTIKLIDGFIPNNGDTTFKLMDARNIYYDDTHNLSQDNNHGIIEELGNRISSIEDTASIELLLKDYIENTTQVVERSSSDEITGIKHMKSNQIIRTDTFSISSNSVIETRTLNTGEILTISTNLSSLASTITYTPISN